MIWIPNMSLISELLQNLSMDKKPFYKTVKHKSQKKKRIQARRRGRRRVIRNYIAISRKLNPATNAARRKATRCIGGALFVWRNTEPE
jgi:hypothetical protein